MREGLKLTSATQLLSCGTNIDANSYRRRHKKFLLEKYKEIGVEVGVTVREDLVKENSTIVVDLIF